MEVEVSGTDPIGDSAYAVLFENVIGDMGKASTIDRATLLMKPELPLFVFSVMLRNAPVAKTVSDAATFRQEREELHISIYDERHAPDVLAQLWRLYGRAKVEQQTRFDLVVHGGREEEVSSIEISSGEATIKEVLGAVWRVMPEGIRVRRTQIDGRVVTITATEEIMKPEFASEGEAQHRRMVELSKEASDV